MKQIKGVCLFIALLISMTSSSAIAHGGGHFRGHGGHGFGFYWGLPLPFYLPFYPPFYSYPPIIPAPAPPQNYIQRYDGPQIAAPLPPNYWYYCRDWDAYYPYVRECPGGWQQVLPQPPTR